MTDSWASPTDRVTISDRPRRRQREGRSVVGVRDRRRACRLRHILERLPVVAVPVRGDDRGQRSVADQAKERLRLVRGVDQQQLAGVRAAEQVGIVVHGADGDLGDGQAGKLPALRLAAHGYVAGVAHGVLSVVLSVLSTARTRCHQYGGMAGSGPSGSADKLAPSSLPSSQASRTAPGPVISRSAVASCRRKNCLPVSESVTTA